MLKFFKSWSFWLSISLIAFMVSVVLLVWPSFVGELPYRLNKPDANAYKYKVTNPSLLQPGFNTNVDLANSTDAAAQIKVGNTLPAGNRLVIPKIGVDSAILEGNELEVLDQYEGVWREPGSGDPLSLSNMVLAGHRFQYLPPNTVTFYHLDKLTEGDKIIVYWKEDGIIKDYIYQINRTLMVNPSDTYVRNHNSTNGKEITLYTCGPEVGANNKRIVVKGTLIS